VIPKRCQEAIRLKIIDACVGVMTKLLAYAAMEHLLKAVDAEMRVGEDAKVALKEALEEYSKRVGEKAITYARHAGRKTIKAEDVRLAQKELQK
jgi:DNA-binding protein